MSFKIVVLMARINSLLLDPRATTMLPWRLCQEIVPNQAPVAQACIPSYSLYRDQEDWGSKTAGQTVLQTLSQRNPSQKRAGGMTQSISPEFKPQYHKKRKKELVPMYLPHKHIFYDHLHKQLHMHIQLCPSAKCLQKSNLIGINIFAICFENFV
jgi:hypothetical protein